MNELGSDFPERLQLALQEKGKAIAFRAQEHRVLNSRQSFNAFIAESQSHMLLERMLDLQGEDLQSTAIFRFFHSSDWCRHGARVTEAALEVIFGDKDFNIEPEKKSRLYDHRNITQKLLDNLTARALNEAPHSFESLELAQDAVQRLDFLENAIREVEAGGTKFEVMTKILGHYAKAPDASQRYAGEIAGLVLEVDPFKIEQAKSIASA